MWRFLLLFSILIASVTLAKPLKYEGFGSATKGGEGKPVYHVTSLKDDGSHGTLRAALSRGDRYVVFDIAGDIVIHKDLVVSGSNITIDASTAPYPGITLRKSREDIVALIIRDVHDVIITHLRVFGLMKEDSDISQNHAGTIAVYTRGTGSVHNIVIDHVTTRNAIDSGLDLWGEISNVTIQFCLIAYSFHPQTISHYSREDIFKKRRNISIHHNIYARNSQRNPQLRADSRKIDYVNNIIYDWGYWNMPEGETGYGVRVKNKWRPGEPRVTINIINNAFIATRNPAWALVYGKDAGSEENDEGPDHLVPQGAVYTGSDMDSLYVFGNLLPEENMDNYSTISNPIPVPDYAKVTTFTVAQLADSVAPFVGTHYPLADEQEIFKAISDSLKNKLKEIKKD